MARSIANIHDRFVAQITRLAEHAAERAAAFKLSGQLPAYQPDKGEWDGDLSDLKGMAKAFDRTEIGEGFQQVLTGEEGNVGDLCVLSLQGDLLGAQERAYRGRHLGFVRGQVHAMARLTEHGKDTGPIVRGIGDHVQNLLKRARSYGGS